MSTEAAEWVGALRVVGSEGVEEDPAQAVDRAVVGGEAVVGEGVEIGGAERVARGDREGVTQAAEAGVDGGIAEGAQALERVAGSVGAL